MSKKYQVSVDILVTKTLLVDAESEADAKAIANNLVTDEPYYHIQNCALYGGHEVKDAREISDDENKEE